MLEHLPAALKILLLAQLVVTLAVVVMDSVATIMHVLCAWRVWPWQRLIHRSARPWMALGMAPATITFTLAFHDVTGAVLCIGYVLWLLKARCAPCTHDDDDGGKPRRLPLPKLFRRPNWLPQPMNAMREV